MAAVFGKRLRRGVITAAVAAAAVAALSASQAPGVTAPQADGGRSAADRSDSGDTPDQASGPDYYTDLPDLNSPTDAPTATPGSGGGTGAAQAGLPATVLDAYKKAEAELATSKPGCNLPWQLLAAIGKVESGQANGGDVYANGDTKHQITGPPLDGNGFAKITDTDGGLFDGDTVHDRAVGPMQFIPSTWEWAGRDGNGDGKKDPNNVYDAALAAGHYLCRNGWDLSNASDLNKAILSYNNSSDYLAKVLAWLEYYRKGTYEVPDGTGVLPKYPSSGGSGSGSGGSGSSPKPSPSPGDTSGSGGSGGSSGSGGSGSGSGGGNTGGSSPSPTPSEPTSPTDSVTKLSDAGTGTLSAMAGDTFGEQVQVRARDKAGKGVGEVKIRFTLIGETDARFAGDATSAVVTTNSSGTATAPKLTAGEQTGGFTVRAVVVGRSLSGLDYKATVTARAADTLARTTDTELSCVAGGTFDDTVKVKATYKGAVADGVAATATLIKSADDATEATTGPYFKDADGKTMRTLTGLKTDKDGLLELPKMYADDATGTFLLRINTTGGGTLTVELKVTAAPSDGSSATPTDSTSPSASPSA
ncbi:lytic transglycosylase domain-containing protein [Streptomyces sp. VRA16 Mangrove soil]|uniref:lytic transglycosylase domain-containing protein n=1 Tax=Streptomyces sp. VRA16 Mangrove soil TaxID=2817434 RepID=UPI001A9E9424|nr:lytic transglycosylase domain-containing protein [Streptomyces sp. VRA16 Mangrove soil]MBO1335409.1 lytic murein transglycosylase [Streptomyces sp. VRA16 Mangrove soil]